MSRYNGFLSSSPVALALVAVTGTAVPGAQVKITQDVLVNHTLGIMFRTRRLTRMGA